MITREQKKQKLVALAQKQASPPPPKTKPRNAFNVKDAVVRPPEFYEDPEGTGIYSITFSPPWPQRVGWPFRLRKVSALLRPDDDVLELGCGFAVQAAMIHHETPGWRGTYTGWDFAPGAIKIGRDGLVPLLGERARLEVVNLDVDEGRMKLNDYVTERDKNRPVIVCCETLEHLEHDVELVEAIPSGTFCIFSVPQFWAHSHLRKFPTPKDAKERYGHLMYAYYQHYQFYPVPQSGWILIVGERR